MNEAVRNDGDGGLLEATGTRGRDDEEPRERTGTPGERSGAKRTGEGHEKRGTKGGGGERKRRRRKKERKEKGTCPHANVGAATPGNGGEHVRWKDPQAIAKIPGGGQTTERDDTRRPRRGMWTATSTRGFDRRASCVGVKRGREGGKDGPDVLTCACVRPGYRQGSSMAELRPSQPA